MNNLLCVLGFGFDFQLFFAICVKPFRILSVCLKLFLLINEKVN